MDKSEQKEEFSQQLKTFAKELGGYIEKDAEWTMNCTPFVRQYDILSNKWGAVH